MAHSQEEMQENSALPNFYNSNIGHKFIYLFILLFIYIWIKPEINITALLIPQNIITLYMQ